jgi:subfamily B ATP-binding cassette protein MsbA
MIQLRQIGRKHETDKDSRAPRITRQTLGTFLRLLGYVRPYRFWMGLSVLALLFSAAINLILPLVIGHLVDVVFAGEGTLDTLNQLALGLFGIFFLGALLSFAHRLSLAYVGEHAIADLRKEAYRRLQALSLSFYSERRTGEIVSRLTNDVALLQAAISDNLVELLRQAITLIGAAAFLIWLNWQLTAIILIGIPLISLTMVWLGGKIRAAARLVQDQIAESANVLEETTSGVRIVKSFAREPYEIGRYSRAVDGIYRAAMRRARIAAILGPTIGFMAFASIITTLWFGSRQVLNGQLSPGDLVSYLIYTLMVATPVSALAGLYAQFQSALGATERLFDLIDTPPAVTDAPDATPLPPIGGAVTFGNVSFRYEKRVDVLNELSFSAEPGELIALVGPSGAGKSTLITLIPRFYDVDSGRITIDGHDIRTVTMHSLREQIGIVPQESLLFSDTVAANIRYGKLDATPEEIEAAARAANAHQFILNDLADGYDTLVGERGVKLSGGQRQRVSIARAILKNPRILILDEATSSLDSESERLVQEALERLMHGRTSFVIAHRLSTILKADRILVMENGRIVEQGRHADLLLNPDGLYTRLYQIQFGDNGRLTPDPF